MTDIARDDRERQLDEHRHAKPAPRSGDLSSFEAGAVEAVGKASEALEYVERARGHLYSFHQLMGRADLLFGDAADQLREGGHPTEAAHLDVDIVGRNVLDGRWTFQVVEEFDDLYYRAVVDAVRGLERRLMNGHRHVREARLKEERRTRDRVGHESRPPAAHSPEVVTEG
jgi:hypothetical protein